jgi:hypothetical protein
MLKPNLILLSKGPPLSSLRSAIAEPGGSATVVSEFEHAVCSSTMVQPRDDGDPFTNRVKVLLAPDAGGPGAWETWTARFEAVVAVDGVSTVASSSEPWVSSPRPRKTVPPRTPSPLPPAKIE